MYAAKAGVFRSKMYSSCGIETVTRSVTKSLYPLMFADAMNEIMSFNKFAMAISSMLSESDYRNEVGNAYYILPLLLPIYF